MKLKYTGSLMRLQKILGDCGGFGEWLWLEPARCYQFRLWVGEIVNWWPSTGTVSFQGRPGPLQPRLIAVFVRRTANDDSHHMVNQHAIIG